MALSSVTKVGDGASTIFAVNFALDFIAEADVKARVGTEVDGSGNPAYRAITFLSTNLLQIAGTPAGNLVPILFTRTVDPTALVVDFQDGDVLTEENMNTAQKQALMLIHELKDGFSTIEDTVANAMTAIPGYLATGALTLSQTQDVLTQTQAARDAALAGALAGNRTLLGADKTIYVRSAPQDVTISIANPGVMNWPAHGLSLNAPVVLFIRPFSIEVTVSIATPSAIGFTGISTLIPLNTPFLVWTSGTLPTNCGEQQQFYAKAFPTADTMTYSLTPGGAAVTTTGTQSGIHILRRNGVMPTGLVQGVVYYVKTIVDANNVTLSATPGGAAIITTGSTSGQISATSGNDTNSGFTNTPSGAKLTPNAGWAALQAFDVNYKNATLQFADSKYLVPLSVSTPLINAASTNILGNATYPDNVLLSIANDIPMNIDCNMKANLNGFALENTGTAVTMLVRGKSIVFAQNFWFGACGADHQSIDDASLVWLGMITVYGSPTGSHQHASTNCKLGMDGARTRIIAQMTVGGGDAAQPTGQNGYWVGTAGNAFLSFSGYGYDGAQRVGGIKSFIHHNSAVRSTVTFPGTLEENIAGGSRNDLIGTIGLRLYGDAGAAPTFDGSRLALRTINNGAVFGLTGMLSGLVMIQEVASKCMGLYMVDVNAGVILIAEVGGQFVASTSSPAAGRSSLYNSGGVPVIINNTGTAQSYRAINFMIR